MANKFLSDINLTARLQANGQSGSSGQILSSTGTGVEWINQSSIEVSSNLVYFDVKNETGSTILKGKGVMAVGTDGNSGHILIDEMVADGTVESKYFLGVLEEDIPNGGFARVISFGQLSQFNTNGQNGETWADGQVLWCDPANPGDFTITEPDGPNVKIAAAFILNSSTNGKIQVRVQANEGIHDLHDTKITSQVDGDVLVWDNTTGVWFNDSTLNVDYTAGNVGIGTTDPKTSLDIVKDADIWHFMVGGATKKLLIGGQAASGDVVLQAGAASTPNNAAVTTPYNLCLQRDGGNVGIGTDDPQGALSVKAAQYRQLDFIESNSLMTIRSTAPDASYNLRGFGVEASSILLKTGATSGTNSTTALTLDDSQNATFAGDVIGGGSITIGSSGGYNAGAIYSDANWGMIFRALQADPNLADFMFANSEDVERLRITSTGATFTDNVYAQKGVFSNGMTVTGNMSTFETTLTDNEDWQNSPISILERGNVQGTETADKYAPNLNFHWGGVVSKSLWMGYNGHLNWGEYSATGIPASDGRINAATFAGDLNGTINTATTGATQTAGDNSTKIATTAYADAAAAAVDPSGVYLPLSAGASYPLTGTLYIGNVEGDQKIQFQRTGGNVYSIEHDSAQLYFYNRTTTEAPLVIQNDGDVLMNAGNVGIGTTSPSTRLEVVDTFSVQRTSTDNEGLYVTVSGSDANAIIESFYQEDSASNYGYRKIYDGSNNLYREFIHDNDPTGTEVYRVDRGTKNTSIANGNVGIGTTNPEAKLDVRSTSSNYVATFKHSTATGYAPGSILLEAGQGSSRGQGIYHYNNVADENWFTGVPYNVNSKKWIVANKSSTVQAVDTAQLTYALMTIDSDTGNVGIGTTNPNKKLEVSAATDTTISIASSDITINVDQNIGILEFASNNESSLSQAYTPFSKIKTISEAAVLGTGTVNGAITFETARGNVISEHMRIDSSGNVGIGTTNPGTDLEIGDGTGSPGLTLNKATTGTASLFFDNGGNNKNWIKADAAESLIFGTNNSTNVTIKEGGNVGIGTTSPGTKLDVDGTARANNFISNNSSTVDQMTLSYKDQNKRTFNSILDFTFTGAGVYYFNVAFSSGGGFSFDVNMVTHRSGNYRNFGSIKDSGYMYWESDADFSHHAQGVSSIASTYGNGIYLDEAPTAFLANNITDTSQGTANYSYFIKRYAVYLPDNTTGADGFFKVTIDTYGYDGDTVHFLNT